MLRFRDVIEIFAEPGYLSDQGAKVQMRCTYHEMRSTEAPLRKTIFGSKAASSGLLAGSSLPGRLVGVDMIPSTPSSSSSLSPSNSFRSIFVLSLGTSLSDLA